MQKEIEFEKFWNTVMSMVSKPAFLITAASYSLCIAVANALQTLLNEIVLLNFPVSGCTTLPLACQISFLQLPVIHYSQIIE